MAETYRAGPASRARAPPHGRVHRRDEPRARRPERVGPDPAPGPGAEGRQGRRRPARRRRPQPAQPVQDRGAEPLQAPRPDQGHPAVHHRHPGAGARRARDVQPARRAAHRARHQPGRGRGGRAPGRQPHPARLPGRQRHLHRRGARPGPVLARHLQPRVGRGAQGPLVGPVRPRLDRRHHQPGQQDAEAHPVLRDQRHRRQRAAGAGHPRLQPALRRRGRPAPEPDGLQGRHPGPRPGHERALGRGAVVRHRPQRPDPADRELLLPGRRQPAGLRPAAISGAARPRSTPRTSTASPTRDYEHDDVHIGTIRLEHDLNENSASAAPCGSP